MSRARSLSAGLCQLGLTASDAQRRQWLDYLELVAKWNRVYNLTAVRDADAMVSMHLLDSLAVAPHLKAQRLLDVGSGAGLPGLPLAILWPDTRVTLLDSNAKKTTFMQQAAIELGLRNVEVVHARVEQWRSPAPFDVVISRAFAELADFVPAARRFCAPGATLAAMKGVCPTAEIARLPPGCTVRAVLPLRVPGLDAERHLVLLDP